MGPSRSQAAPTQPSCRKFGNLKMPFTRNVEIGRLAMVNYGPDYGKLVVITDVLDHHRALVDHPDQLRRVESFKRLSLTDFKARSLAWPRRRCSRRPSRSRRSSESLQPAAGARSSRARLTRPTCRTLTGTRPCWQREEECRGRQGAEED